MFVRRVGSVALVFMMGSLVIGSLETTVNPNDELHQQAESKKLNSNGDLGPSMQGNNECCESRREWETKRIHMILKVFRGFPSSPLPLQALVPV
jgi:hypothetical protein